MADLDPDALNKLRVVDLRNQLSSRSLPTSGLKAELVKRLRDAVISEQAAQTSLKVKQEIDEDDSSNTTESESRSITENDDSSRDVDDKFSEKMLQIKEAEQRRMAEAQAQEEQRRAAEQERLEEEQAAADLKRQEELRIAAERRQQEMRRQEELRIAEVKRKEEQRVLEAKRQEELRLAEQRRLERIEEERRMAEKARLAEEQTRFQLEQQRIAEEKRLADEKNKFEQEQQRLAKMKQLEEEKILKAIEEKNRAEQQKLAELKKLQEQKRVVKVELDEQNRLAEQQRRFQEQQQRLFEEEQKKKKLADLKNKADDHQRLILVQPKIECVPEKITKSEYVANEDDFESMDSSETGASEIELPPAIEKLLALKNERAKQLGVDSSADPNLSGTKNVRQTANDEDEYLYGENDDAGKKSSESKKKRRKKKKKQRKIQQQMDTSNVSQATESSSVDVDIEYVQEVIDVSDPMYTQFMKVFDRFKLTDSEKDKDASAEDAAKNANKDENLNPMALRKKPVSLDDDDDDDERDDDKMLDEKPKLSKRKLKKLTRMTVAELKQKVTRPELVEMHDVTAKDPLLLLHLKATRNTVPVPRHWCFKRKYLQGKRGIEKPAFELPDFIKRTGIMEMRQALQEKEDQKSMKAKMRERIRPKMGKIDIDYQKLHDAFFKWQTKPRMTIHGDLYYEGKEFETRLKEKKPGDLSEDMRTALGMPTGPNANKCPPPWLIAMQRYGPPPSYPNLKIPGLNAPIPDGCSFGYHAGGWGKPPVDEMGKPLYGDVFGTQMADDLGHLPEEELDHTLWGELESESSEEEEEQEEESAEEEEEKVEDESGLVTPAEGLITPSGFSSIPAGMETPDMIELRKRKIESEMEGGDTPALYTILPEKKAERVGAAMMGSTHVYDLSAAIPGNKLKPGVPPFAPQGVEVALDPSELEMDTAAMAARYEQTVREQQSQLEKEDLSDMVAEHAARQKNKRKKQQVDTSKPAKKYKEFKF